MKCQFEWFEIDIDMKKGRGGMSYAGKFACIRGA